MQKGPPLTPAMAPPRVSLLGNGWLNERHEDAAATRLTHAALASIKKIAAHGSASALAPSPAPPTGEDAGSVSALRVVVRVRPLPEDCQRSTAIQVEAEAGTRAVAITGVGRFRFHRIFANGEDNAHVHEQIGQPLVQSVLQGYSSTLLAYGQTGTGKTFTLGEAALVGSPSEGMVPRMLRQVCTRA